MKKISMATAPHLLLKRVSSNRTLLLLTAGLTGFLLAPTAPATAQSLLINETFTGSTTISPWTAANAPTGGTIPAIPCLTASPTTAANPPAAAPTSVSLGSVGCPAGAPFLSEPSGEGALRLSSNAGDQAGFVLYGGAPLASGNGFVITFDFFSYNGDGADGISFFLVDGSVNPSASGAFGGSLGYAQKTIAGGAPADVPGLAGGHLGIGLDEFGNFPNDTEGRTGSTNGTPTGFSPNNVSVRGAGNGGLTGYPLIGRNIALPGQLSPTAALPDRSGARRTARVTLTPNGFLSVDVDFGSGFVNVIPLFDTGAVPGQPALPATFRFGFGASTGGQNNYHEIKNFRITTTPSDLSIIKTAGGAFAIGQNSTFNLAVTNSAAGGSTTGPITVADTLPAGLNLISATGTNWNCTITGQTINCTYTGGTLTPGQAAPPITVTVVPTASAPNSITNSATVTTPGDSNPGNNTSSVTVPIPQTPVIGVAKQIGTPIDNGNGTFTLPYTFLVRNYGNVDLANVQIDEPLGAVYGAPATFTIAGPPQVTNVTSPIAGSNITANPAFTGTGGNISLLATAGQALTVGASATVTLNVIVTPNGNFGPYINQARATGTDAAGNPVFDDSTNGANPDDGDPNLVNNNDGNPSNNSVPTQITLPNNTIPKLGVAKQVSPPVNNNDGSYTVTYTLLVRNFGPVVVNNVQLIEDLFGSPNSTFAGATSAVVVAPPAIVNGVLTATNPAFNGNSNQNLLAGTESLGVNQTATLTFGVRVVPGNLTTFNNFVTATGVGPNGRPLPPQRSVDQTGVANPTPDPNGDGDPTNDPSTPTPISFSLPKLGVAKQVSPPTVNDDGSYTVAYTVLVKNFGSVPVRNVQLIEDLFGSPNSTFAGAISAVVVGPPTIVSGVLTAANPAFNGNSNQNLLAGTETLNPNQTSTLTFNVRVVPGNLSTFNNVVTATGIGPNGQPLPPQQSVDQTGVANPNPDLNGDSDPSNDAGPNTRTPITFGPRFRLLKRITSATRGGAPISGVNFGSVVNDAEGLTTAINAAGLPPIGVPSIPPSTPLASGDEVEYTIYFLSDGGTPAIDTNLCDQIPLQASLIADTNRLKLGGAAPVRGGTVFSPIAPLPANNSCSDQSNPNGSVIFGLGNVPSVRGSNSGFVQFRVRIN